MKKQSPASQSFTWHGRTLRKDAERDFWRTAPVNDGEFEIFVWGPSVLSIPQYEAELRVFEKGNLVAQATGRASKIVAAIDKARDNLLKFAAKLQECGAIDWFTILGAR